MKRDCTIIVHVATTKALISCAVTAQLISAFVFAYAKIQFSHDMAHLSRGICHNNKRNWSAKARKIPHWTENKTQLSLLKLPSVIL